MKRSTKAAVASFIVPGAGLCYLGEYRQAFVNLLVAAALTAVAVISGHEHWHYAILAIAAGSAGYAHAAAGRIDQPPGVQQTRPVNTTSQTGC